MVIDNIEKKASKPLIGYAVLAENIDSNNLSFLDNFLPLVKQGVLDINVDFDIQLLSKYIEENFGLQLPLYVITYSLKKLQKRNLVKFEKVELKYKVIGENGSSILQKRDELLIQYELLINRMQEFLVNHQYYKKSFTTYELESMLEDFIFQTTENLATPVKSDNSSKEQNQRNFLTGRFITYIEQNEPHLYSIYKKLFIGNMISSAMYFTEQDKINQKFKKTSVYFDTTLIIYALGYAGDLRAEPVNQLIKLLRSQYAQIRCFEHTVAEVRGVLNGCLLKYKKGDSDRFGTVEYFINKNYSESEILTIINAIENDIESKLNIKIVPTPDFSDESLHKYNMDVEGYIKSIKEVISYNYEDSLNKDIDSINAIYRLRKGQHSTTLEKSKAIFVTNNNSLVKVVSDKFYREHHNSELFSPLISDYVLATLLWIKNPDTESELPQKMIAANCLAAVEPSEKMYEKYLNRIEKERDKGTISEESFALLRTASEAKSLMMDIVVGDEDQINYLDVKELAELTIQIKVEEKEKQIAQKDHEISTLTIEKIEIENSVKLSNQELKLKEEEFSKIQENRLKNAKLKTEKIANKTINLLTGCIVFTLLIVYLYLYNNPDANIVGNIFVQFIIPGVSFLGFGILYFIKPVRKKAINSLSDLIYSWFYKNIV